MNADDRYTDAYGRVVFRVGALVDLWCRGDMPDDLVVEDDPTVADYNGWCDSFGHPEFKLHRPERLEISAEDFHQLRAGQWLIEESYAVDVPALLRARCTSPQARARVDAELAMFEERGLLPVLRLLNYLVERLRAAGVWWGVGRGSSCASYCLFLLGVHKIDSLAYDLPIGEFLR